MTKRSSLNMFRQIVSFSEGARTLEYHVDAHLAPRQLGGVAFAQNGIILAVNMQAVFVCVDIPRPSSVYGVEFSGYASLLSWLILYNGGRCRE
jgi:hypothetical protein